MYVYLFSVNSVKKIFCEMTQVLETAGTSTSIRTAVHTYARGGGAQKEPTQNNTSTDAPDPLFLGREQIKGSDFNPNLSVSTIIATQLKKT